MGFQLGVFSWEGFLGSSEREGVVGVFNFGIIAWRFFSLFFTFLAYIFKDYGEGVAHLV